jgi:transcriptional regulator with XRE-family HTH domain
MATRTKKVKSVDKGEYAVAWALLRAARQAAKLTQRQLAAKLGRSQTFVGDVELGRRRLDVLQLYDWCKATGTTLSAYAHQVEATLDVLPKNLPKTVRAPTPRATKK